MPRLAMRVFASPLVPSLRTAAWRLALAAVVILGLTGLPRPAHAIGTWTKIIVAPLIPAGTVALLTDGRILVGDGGQTWFTLTPDSAGHYEASTWSSRGSIASSHVGRAGMPSTILNDGRFLIAGGEYITGLDRATMDIYDPVTNTWTSGPDMPKPVGDTAASILDDGTFMVASVWYPQVYAYNPTTNAWTQKADIGTGNSGDEKGWTLLPNGNVLDIFDTWSVYTPSTNSWSTPATPPVPLIGYPPLAGAEIGPMSLLHSGKVVQFGAADSGSAANTAILDPSNSTWTLAPAPPDGYQFGDTPASVLPNGHVLCQTAVDGFGGPAVHLYELDPAANPPTFTNVPFPAPDMGSFLFLNLPTGQILAASSNAAAKNWYLYTPSGGPQSAWRPSITSISAPSGGVFTLAGTKLNGLTTGSSFGDDQNMATNYPIVSLVDASGTKKYYARSYGFNHMAPGAATSTKFELPPIIPNGTYTVHVTANGVDSSNTQSLTVSGTHVTQLTGGGTTARPGTSLTWTVTLSTAAPSGGTKVTLASTDTGVATVPASVTVPQGATSTTFSVTGQGFGRAMIIAATSTANPQFKPARRLFGWMVSTILPGALDPTNPNAPFTAMVTLSDVAPTGGLTVNLSSNLPGVAPPATVTIPAGTKQSALFNISNAVNPSVAMVYASLRGSTAFTNLSPDNRWAWMQTLWK